MSVEDFVEPQGGTRAVEDAADYKEIKAITLAFYSSDGTEVYKHEQLKSDNTTYTTFGEFTCSLPLGKYTMVAIGRGNFSGDTFILTSPTEAAYTSERARETFSGTEEVLVTSGAPLDLNVTLNRICAKLYVLSTDNRPSSVTHYKTTYAAGGKGFNPTTGFATSNNGFVVGNSAGTPVGETCNFVSFLFLAADEQDIDVTIEALDDEDNVLFTKTIEDVPFKRNRVTKLRGSMFTAGASTASFQFETSWIDEEVIDF
jgi:hypothetical protein